MLSKKGQSQKAKQKAALLNPNGMEKNKHDVAFKAISRAKLDDMEMKKEKPPNVGHYNPKFDIVEQ